jgi:hypothetical protein
MSKLAVAVIAALCLVVPTVAAAEDHGHGVDHITCGDGTALTPPLASPVCAEHGGVASVTCVSGAVLTPPLGGKRCPASENAAPPAQQLSGGDGAGGGDDAGAGDEADRGRHGDAPPLKAAFLNRVWRIAGSAAGFQDGVLDFSADRILGLPKRFASQDDALVDQDARVLVTPRTRVFDAGHHRLSGDAAASALDAADTVLVMAKLLPQATWQQDDDSTPVPTLRAKKIVIQS